MSTNFSANQYEKSFAAQRLQNWQVPKNFKEHPSPKVGGTRPISNDRGHLLDGVHRAKTSPWGNFKGTWDYEMDCRKTVHCQTLATLKSEGTSCLNNQIKKTQHLKQNEMTLTNKQQDAVFQDFSKLKPDKSGSPVASPIGEDKTKLLEVQQEIQVASPIQPIKPATPDQKIAASPLRNSPRVSPIAGTPKPSTPVTPVLEDRPATPVKPNTPKSPLIETGRKSASPYYD